MLDLGESSYANVGHDDNITPVFTPQHQAHIGTSLYGEHSIVPQHTQQHGEPSHRVRKQKKRFGLSKFLSCFNPKTKEDRRRKRSVAKIFLGENKRQKRMYDPSGYYHDPSGYNPSGSYYETSTSEHAGPSMTPPRSSQLTVTECGHWLAPIWFGFNLMLFILGWMLLAIQYYPMFA
ncbi:hypothetical protein ACQ4LE_003540 [Meloidogyne hapla]